MTSTTKETIEKKFEESAKRLGFEKVEGHGHLTRHGEFVPRKKGTSAFVIGGKTRLGDSSASAHIEAEKKDAPIIGFVFKDDECVAFGNWEKTDPGPNGTVRERPGRGDVWMTFATDDYACVALGASKLIEKDEHGSLREVPAERYLETLVALKSHPEDVVFWLHKIMWRLAKTSGLTPADAVVLTFASTEAGLWKRIDAEIWASEVRLSLRIFDPRSVTVRGNLWCEDFAAARKDDFIAADAEEVLEMLEKEGKEREKAGAYDPAGRKFGSFVFRSRPAGRTEKDALGGEARS